MSNQPVPATDGDRYLPYEQRTGEEAVVYFTRDLSAGGLQKIFRRIADRLCGKIAVKVHTGELNGPNIIPRDWVAHLFREELSDAAIVETNTYYQGDRYTTEQHLQTAAANGWTFAPVDILDADGAARFPVKDGKWFDHMSIGAHLKNYDSMLTLTHFKGHTLGGFGGSNKNLGIGCADGPIGKGMIHSPGGGAMWGIKGEELMERMTESTKSVTDFFGEHIAYINVMRNMSVSCDCEGVGAAPVVTPNVGICASVDLLAVDQACVDLIYAMTPRDRHALVERMETRHGHRQLSYMKELGMGHDKYRLIDIDNDDEVITAEDAVADVVPFVLD